MFSLSSVDRYPPPESVTSRAKKKSFMGCMCMCFLPKLKNGSSVTTSSTVDNENAYRNRAFDDTESDYETPISVAGRDSFRRSPVPSQERWQRANSSSRAAPQRQPSLYPMMNPVFSQRESRRSHVPHPQGAPAGYPHGSQLRGAQPRYPHSSFPLDSLQEGLVYNHAVSRDPLPLEQYTEWHATTVQADQFGTISSSSIHSRSVRPIAILDRSHAYPVSSIHGTCSSVFIARPTVQANTQENPASVRSCVFTAHKPRLDRNHENSILRNEFWSDTRETQEADITFGDDYGTLTLERRERDDHDRLTSTTPYLPASPPHVTTEMTHMKTVESSTDEEPVYETLRPTHGSHGYDENHNDVNSSNPMGYNQVKSMAAQWHSEDDDIIECDAEPYVAEDTEDATQLNDDYPVSYSVPSTSYSFDPAPNTTSTQNASSSVAVHPSHQGGVYIHSLLIQTAHDVHIGDSVAQIPATQC